MKLSKSIITNIENLSQQASECKEDNKKAYLNLRLYLLLVYVQNHFELNQNEQAVFDGKFKESVTYLTKYFDCSPMTLPSHLLSTVGKEVSGFFAADDNENVASSSLLYLKREEALNFKTLIDDGILYYQQPVNKNKTKELTEREFVFSMSGDLYIINQDRKNIISNKKDTYMRHSSFLAGDEVLCAGMITAIDGKIIEISNNSGHYRPSHKEIAIFVNHLNDLGVDISKIKLSLVFPKLNIGADAFLSFYPELQTLNNELFDTHVQNRKESFKNFKAVYLSNNPSENLNKLLSQTDKIILEVKQKVTDRYSEWRQNLEGKSSDELIDLNMKINFEIKKETTENIADLWVRNFKDAPDSTESVSFLLRIWQNKNFDKNYLDNILKPYGFSAKEKFNTMKNPSERKENSAQVEKLSNESVKEMLLSVQQYIENTEWDTLRGKLGLKNQYPTHVKKILDRITSGLEKKEDSRQIFYQILEIGRDAALSSSITRSNDTQKFYDHFKNSDLSSLLELNESKSQLKC